MLASDASDAAAAASPDGLAELPGRRGGRDHERGHVDFPVNPGQERDAFVVD